MVKRFWLVAITLTVLAAAPATGGAAPFTQLVVLGDSLSDNGNVYAAVGFPPPPYAQRFSNGPVAVEYVAAALGIPMRNLAFGGATTGTENFLNTTAPGLGGALPGMRTKFDEYVASLPGGVADPDALYFLWGGANDVFLANVLNRDLITTLNAAVANLASMVGTLRALGADHVFVPGMPDLGLTPGFDGRELQGTLLTDYFNALLVATITPLGAEYFDTASLLRMVVANGAAFGFTNVTEACFVASPPFLCGFTQEQQNAYLFWDGAHPTTRAHSITADAFLQAVPEPTLLLLIGVGLAGVIARRRGR